jgi:hypothetical protein
MAGSVGLSGLGSAFGLVGSSGSTTTFLDFTSCLTVHLLRLHLAHCSGASVPLAIQTCLQSGYSHTQQSRFSLMRYIVPLSVTLYHSFCENVPFSTSYHIRIALEGRPGGFENASRSASLRLSSCGFIGFMRKR